MVVMLPLDQLGKSHGCDPWLTVTSSELFTVSHTSSGCVTFEMSVLKQSVPRNLSLDNEVQDEVDIIEFVISQI